MIEIYPYADEADEQRGLDVYNAVSLGRAGRRRGPKILVKDRGLDSGL